MSWCHIVLRRNHVAELSFDSAPIQRLKHWFAICDSCWCLVSAQHIVMLYGSYSKRTMQRNKENHKALYIFYAINSAFFQQFVARMMEAAHCCTHTHTHTHTHRGKDYIFHRPYEKKLNSGLSVHKRARTYRNQTKQIKPHILNYPQGFR